MAHDAAATGSIPFPKPKKPPREAQMKQAMEERSEMRCLKCWFHSFSKGS